MKALIYVTAFSLIAFSAQAEDDFCQQYPDAPVCLQPSSPGNTFCQEFPENAACQSLHPAAQQEQDSQPSSQIVPQQPDNQEIASPSAPVAPSAPASPAAPAAPEQRTNIVIITDQPGAVRANETKQLLATLPPFSCMNLVVEVMQVTHEQINCEPRTQGDDPSRDSGRLLVCNSDTREFADRVRRSINDDIQVPQSQPERRRGFLYRLFHRRQHQREQSARDAEVALTIVDFNKWSGAGYNHTPLISSQVWAGGGIHEILHGVGFHDEVMSTGTIMGRVDGNVPRSMWPQIAEYFHTTVPESCGSQ